MLHGYNPPERFLSYLSWTEILPCAVDSIICAGVVGHALAKLPKEVPAYAMAPITYGKSEEHLHFPGTITLTGETLLATMIDIGESVYRAGFRKLLIVNGHGGQPQIMEIMAREMRLRHGDYIVVPQQTWRLPHVAGRYMADREKKLAMHAGHAETAIMLALAPETVHMARAVTNYPPEFPSKLLSPDGRPACAWTSRDFGPSGIIGDPLPATREQGDAILESLATSWAQAITELHQLQWAARDEATWGRAQHTGHVQQSLA
jgi:creatinine amidohydrolase